MRKFQLDSFYQWLTFKLCQLRNDMRDQNWLFSIPIFGTKLELPKIQTKIMGSLNMVVRVPM